MVNDLTVEELLNRANPVPDPEELRLSPAEVDARCASILERRGVMQTQTPTRAPAPTPPTRGRWRKPALVFIVSFIIVLVVAGWVVLFRPGEEEEVTDQPTTTTTLPAPTTPAVVDAFVAALNDRDAAAVAALHTGSATHGLYLNGEMTALWDLDVFGAMVADPEYDHVEVVAEPLVSGSVVAVPVRYSYPSEGADAGFELLLLDESSTRIRHGITLLGDLDLTFDASLSRELYYEHDAFGVAPLLDADTELWVMSVAGLSRWSVAEYGEHMNPWLDQRGTVPNALVESGPFIAVSSTSGWDDVAGVDHGADWERGIVLYDAGGATDIQGITLLLYAAPNIETTLPTALPTELQGTWSEEDTWDEGRWGPCPFPSSCAPTILTLTDCAVGEECGRLERIDHNGEHCVYELVYRGAAADWITFETGSGNTFGCAGPPGDGVMYLTPGTDDTVEIRLPGLGATTLRGVED